jgi:lipopolysaccharide heptosyltransferase III
LQQPQHPGSQSFQVEQVSRETNKLDLGRIRAITERPRKIGNYTQDFENNTLTLRPLRSFNLYLLIRLKLSTTVLHFSITGLSGQHAYNDKDRRMTQQPNQTLDLCSINRILVTKLRFHGDVVLSSPVFQSLKNHHPHLEVDALIYEETHDMLSLHPNISQIFTIDRKWRQQGLIAQLKQERRLLAELKARHYDMIIHLTEHWRGFYLKHLLSIPIAVTGQYPRRKNSRLWQRCFTHKYPLPQGRDKIASHLDALRCLGIPVSTEEEHTSLTISTNDKSHVQQLLSKNGLSNKAFILIHPTSRFFYKCWPPRTMASLINRLTEQDIKVVVTAAPSRKEAQYIEEMHKSISSPIVDLSGKLTLKQLGAAIQQSRCFIGVDSAPMHMAVAVGTPVVALFGPTNTDVWGPKSDSAMVLQSHTTSKPPLVNGERPNELENCTLDIDMEAVLQATLKLVNTASDHTPLI